MAELIRPKLLEWDSNFFDLKVGLIEIDAPEQVNHIDPLDFDVIYVFSSISLDQALMLEPVDVKIIYTKTQNQLQPENNNIEIYQGELNEELRTLALESGAYSRFKIDPKLKHQFEDLYFEWIKNSVEGDFADFVCIQKSEDQIVGFSTLKKKGNFYDIGLIAVDANNRGTGIGAKLMHKMESIAGSTSEIRVATQQQNEAACDFYSKLGYQVYSTTYIYHLWP